MGVERTRSTAQATAEGLRVFVAGVPWHIKEETLKRDFEECGLVEDFFLLRDPEGNSRGKAFVTYREQEAVKAALEYNATEYAGRTIFVKLAEAKRPAPPKEEPEAPRQPRHGTPAREFPEERPEGCTSLCLKGTGDASEDDIRKLLKGCAVQSVRVVRDRSTGLPRGIAFVDFPAGEEVDKAMAFNGKKVNGHVVDMRFEAPKARPRPEGCLAVAIKKLGPEASEADVRQLFEGLSSIQDVRLIRDKQQLGTGLAFVEFGEASDVEAAVRRDGMSVLGRTVFVCYETKQKKARGSGPGAGQPPQEQKAGQNKKRKGGERAAPDSGKGDAQVESAEARPQKKKRNKKKPAVAGDEGEKKKPVVVDDTGDGGQPTSQDDAQVEDAGAKPRKRKKAPVPQDDGGQEGARAESDGAKPAKRKKAPALSDGEGGAVAKQEREAQEPEAADAQEPAAAKPRKKKKKAARAL